MEWSHVLVTVALLSLGVVYGTDVFFAAVGQSALKAVSEASLTEVLGRLHEYADKRMPVFSVLGMLSTAGLVTFAHIGTLAGKLALSALLMQLTHLAVYAVVSKPVNVVLTAAAIKGEPVENAQALQRRWDGVIVLRAVLLGTAMLCLALAAWKL